MGTLFVGLAMLGVFLTRGGPYWLNLLLRILGGLYCVGVCVFLPLVLYGGLAKKDGGYLMGSALAVVLTAGALYYFVRAYHAPKVRR